MEEFALPTVCRSLRRGGWALALATASLGAACGQAPRPAPTPAEPAAEAAAPTLRVTTRTVEISAVVRNKAGEPQDSLTKDDFVLKVDGKLQPIRYFSVADDLPLTLALLVDVSGSQRTFIGDEWRASDIFFETMLTRPQDRAMLVEVDARVVPLTNVTNRLATLHVALSQLGVAEKTAFATRLNDALYFIAKDFLSEQQGRKAIILLTDGGDNGSQRKLVEAIEQAQRRNIAVYAIVYSSWVGMDYDFRQGLSTLNNGQSDPGAAYLKKLAEATGGHVYTVERGSPLKKIYEAIASDLRTQYQLGYAPPPDLQPNSFHKLELRTTDKKLTVQARTGFYVQP